MYCTCGLFPGLGDLEGFCPGLGLSPGLNTIHCPGEANFYRIKEQRWVNIYI